MPDLTYFVATSIDGFIADPVGDFSAFLSEGDHITHLISEFPETLPVHARTALGIDDPGGTFDTVVMGWNTFAVGLAEGVASPYPHLRQLVFSRHDRTSVVGDGVEIIHDEPRVIIDQLRNSTSERDVWLCGGSQLAGQLAESIDRIVLKVNPITLGTGIPLFSPTRPTMALFEQAAPPLPFDSGVVILDYRRRN